jgi:hypothetical protein
MKIKKGKPVESLDELAYKLAEKLAEFETGEITEGQMNTYSKTATAITNIFRTKIVNNMAGGIKDSVSLSLIGDDRKYIGDAKDIKTA